MEKVTFPPLITLLQENAEALNLLLQSNLAVSRQFKTADVPVWFKEVVEPVFKALYEFDQTRSRKFFDVLYRDMLTTLSRAETNVDFELSKSLRLLIVLNPAATATSAANLSRVLVSLSTALQRISKHSRQASCKWIALLKQIIPFVKDSDELLAAGRMAAWRCGMAHLRDRVDFFAGIDKRIISAIFPDENCEPGILKRRWNKDAALTSRAAGGFTGFGGKFSRPPRLAINENIVFVSDGIRTMALFADRFGHLLQECADSFSVLSGFALTPVKSALPGIAKILARYPDLTSWVHHDSTLYVTTESSHSVFLFGAIDE